jgi:hypothetical protein
MNAKRKIVDFHLAFVFFPGFNMQDNDPNIYSNHIGLDTFPYHSLIRYGNHKGMLWDAYEFRISYMFHPK